MISCMKARITLDDELAKDLRRRANEAGLTISAFVERTLRDALSRHLPSDGQRPFRLVTVTGKGLQPGVDLDRGAKLTEAEDLDGLVRAGR
jgi:hypothetical protein